MNHASLSLPLSLSLKPLYLWKRALPRRPDKYKLINKYNLLFKLRHVCMYDAGGGSREWELFRITGPVTEPWKCNVITPGDLKEIFAGVLPNELWRTSLFRCLPSLKVGLRLDLANQVQIFTACIVLQITFLNFPCWSPLTLLLSILTVNRSAGQVAVQMPTQQTISLVEKACL